MPPRGAYKSIQNRSKPSRPAQESRSDRKEQERAEREAQAKKDAQARKEREKKTSVPKTKPKPIKKSPQHSFADALGRSPTRDLRDNQSQPSGTSADQRNIKINNAVKTTTTKSNMSPPILKPKSPTKFTISGGLIKGGNIYKDEITGSTLAGKETRMKAFSDPKSVKVVGSRSGNTLLQARPDMSQTTLNNTLQKITGNNKDVVDNLTDPSKTKTDLLTGQPIEKIPTLLSDIRKKKNKRNLGGGNFMSQMIRTLLG